MKYLMSGELYRYRVPTLITFVLHLAVLKYASMGDLFAPSTPKFLLGMLCYGLLAAGLGFAQIGTYRRPNQWAYLIHRPMDSKAIAVALMASGLILLTLAVALPLLAITLYLDLFTPQAVDLRHYLMAPYILGFAVSIYLIMTLTLLSPNKAPLLLVGLVGLFATRGGSPAWLFGAELVVVFLLAALVILYLRPNLFTQPRSPWKRGLMALSLQNGLYWALIAGMTLVYSLGASIHSSGWRSFADHAWNDYFPPGTREYVGYRNPKEALRHGLRGMDAPNQQELEAQLTFTDVLEIEPQVLRHPLRNQPLILDRAGGLYDADEEVKWTFHHDEMAFQGLQVRRGEVMGWMGPGEDVAFESVPSTSGSRWVLAKSSLYALEAKDAHLDHRMTSPMGDSFTSGISMEGRVAAALTQSHLHLLDPKDVRRAGRPLSPLLSIPIPGDPSSLSRAQVAPLLDGYLISFVMDVLGERGFREPRQITQMAYFNGDVKGLNDITLKPGQPAWVEYRMYLISPSLELAYDVVGAMAGFPRPRVEEIRERQLPSGIRWTGIGLMLMSAGLAFALGTKRGMALKERILWTMLALVFSLPGLMAFWVNNPAPEGLKARHSLNPAHPQHEGAKA